MKTSISTDHESQEKRLYFLDNLRSFFIILVVLHHAALVYGAFAPFYYVEPPFGEALTYKLFLLFGLLNQAWFMGGLFFIAGYFTPASFERKGAFLFLKERFVKLGGAALVFYFILNPIAAGGFWLMPQELTGITAPLSWKAYPELLGLGPLWFAVLLILFSIGYAIIAGAVKGTQLQARVPKKQKLLPVIVSGVIGIALLSYLIRIALPIGKEILGFPSLAYFPQYVVFYAAGIVVRKRYPELRFTRVNGLAAAFTAVLATLLLFPLAFSGNLFSLELNEGIALAMGGGHWRSALYAAWDNTFAAGLLVFSLAFFQRALNKRSRLGRLLADESFAVYIIHIPIMVYAAWLLRVLPVGNLAKFILLSIVVVPLCFIIAALVRRIVRGSDRSPVFRREV